MSPTDTVTWACAHQDLLVQILAWAGGSSLVMSPIAWATAKWGKLPPVLQAIIQALALNVVHAVAGEPVKAPPADKV